MRIFLVMIIALLLTGCSTTVTYIPISWGMGEKVKNLTQQDEFLKVLFNRYDPERTTLRVSGESFYEVLTPDTAAKRQGAYRTATHLIYRNFEKKLSDQELRSVMTHEIAHHVWFNFLKPEQKTAWQAHLEKNPSEWQKIVRQDYPEKNLHAAEDFAFTIAAPRKTDIEMLASLGVISAKERDAVLRTGIMVTTPVLAKGLDELPPDEHQMRN
jgi:hypothetical protein